VLHSLVSDVMHMHVFLLGRSKTLREIGEGPCGDIAHVSLKFHF
jgi:hypothetical protein